MRGLAARWLAGMAVVLVAPCVQTLAVHAPLLRSPPVRLACMPASRMEAALKMSSQPLGSNETTPVDFSSVVIPNSMPTFGLSARQSMRLAYMYRREEPLPQEIFGLQVLIGLVGSQLMGVMGAVMGFFQFAPCLSFFPGQGGEILRATGWHIFTLTVKVIEAVNKLLAAARTPWTRIAEMHGRYGRRTLYPYR